MVPAAAVGDGAAWGMVPFWLVEDTGIVEVEGVEVAAVTKAVDAGV